MGREEDCLCQAEGLPMSGRGGGTNKVSCFRPHLSRVECLRTTEEQPQAGLGERGFI